MTELTAVGMELPRLGASEKLRGRTLFVDDIQRVGMLHAAVLLATHAHARIVSVDVSEASASPGVHCVLTGDDFPHRFGPFVQDETVLARDRVRYFGEPVAVVAAESLEEARQAIQLINVDYEPLEAVDSIDEALAPNAPIIHEEFAKYGRRHTAALPPNVCARTIVVEGQPEDAFSSCDLVVEGMFETQPQIHCYLEPCGAVAEVDDHGKVTIWSACQSVFRVQATVAETLGMPMAKVRAIATAVGGAFGGKSDVTIQPVTAMLAIRTGRPVKLVLSRNDDFLMMRTRHPARIKLRTGVMRDGTIIARSLDIVMNGGAFAEDSSAVLGFALYMGRGPYRIRHYRAEGIVVYTNRLRSAGFRGYGNPQVTFAGECQLDEIAGRLDIDPIELRLRNAMRTGDKWFGGETARACGLVECLEKVRNASNWSNPRPATPGRRRGLGIASIAHICGILSTSAIVRVLEDGTITLNTGAVDLGQGSETALAQICAESFKVPIDWINFSNPDTDGSPYNWSTGGSRVTYMVGRAVVGAADEARKKLFGHAAALLECAEGDLELRPGGRIGVAGVPGHAVSFHDASRRAHWVSGGPIIGTASVMFDGGIDIKRVVLEGNEIGKFGTFVFGAQVAEVEVDESTGHVKVLNIWAAHDVGKAINPALVRGQISGGVAQGVGYALIEDLVFDSAIPTNPSLMDYKTPGVLDLPRITPIIVEVPEPSGPLGAKGVGEPPIIGVAPAIRNGIASACGVWLNALPLTPERVLNALDQRASETPLP